MGYIQLAMALVSLAREWLKYAQKMEADKSKQVEKLNMLKDGMRKARKEGKTDDIEKAFASLRLADTK